MASRSTAASTAASKATTKRAPQDRPKYYDLNLMNLPMPGLVSIFHRITGVAMFLFLIPLVLVIFQTTLRSPEDFAVWKGYFRKDLLR